jgi:hypothetical protein
LDRRGSGIFSRGGLDDPNQLEFVQQIRANVNWAKAETSSVIATDAKVFDPSGKSPAYLHRHSRRPTGKPQSVLPTTLLASSHSLASSRQTSPGLTGRLRIAEVRVTTTEVAAANSDIGGPEAQCLSGFSREQRFCVGLANAGYPQSHKKNGAAEATLALSRNRRSNMMGIAGT